MIGSDVANLNTCESVMQYSLATLCVLWVSLAIPTEQWVVSLRDSSDISQHGIVEISTGEGTFNATINPLHRSWKVGSVICRQLGQGPLSSSSIVYDVSKSVVYTVTCSGNEYSLSECFVAYSADYSDYHYVLWIECLPAKARDFDVSLVKSNDFLDEGVVFIFINGHWGPVCLPVVNMPAVCDATCKVLGFVNCQHGNVEFYGEILSDPVLENVSCSSTANDLQDCRFDILQRQRCTYHDVTFLKVSCVKRYSYTTSYQYLIPSQSPPSRHSRTVLYVVTVLLLTILGGVLYVCRKTNCHSSRNTVQRISETSAADLPHESLRLPSYEAATCNGRYSLESVHLPGHQQTHGDPQVPGRTQELWLYPSTQLRPVYASQTPFPFVFMDESHSNVAVTGTAVANGEVHGLSNAGIDYEANGGILGMSASDPELPSYEEAVARSLTWV